MLKNIVVLLTVVLSTHSFAQEKQGLLIIAHGSPMSQWNKPVLDLEEQVSTLLRTKGIAAFNDVRVALMEFTEPSVATVVEEMENKGITKIYAVPLFIAPSGHSVYDIPTILGVSYDKTKAGELEEEGIKLVETKSRITIGPTLNDDNVMKDILLDKVKKLSENPKEEALVSLAHGDNDFMPVWEDLCHKTGDYILGKTGMEYFNKAFVEIGQSFAVEGVGSILRASKHKKRVIVTGM